MDGCSTTLMRDICLEISLRLKMSLKCADANQKKRTLILLVGTMYTFVRWCLPSYLRAFGRLYSEEI